MLCEMRALLPGALAVVGSTALGFWLANRGFSDDAWLFVWVLCAVLITVNTIGARRLRALGSRDPMVSTILAFLIVGLLGRSAGAYFSGGPSIQPNGSPLPCRRQQKQGVFPTDTSPRNNVPQC